MRVAALEHKRRQFLPHKACAGSSYGSTHFRAGVQPKLEYSWYSFSAFRHSEPGIQVVRLVMVLVHTIYTRGVKVVLLRPRIFSLRLHFQIHTSKYFSGWGLRRFCFWVNWSRDVLSSCCCSLLPALQPLPDCVCGMRDQSILPGDSAPFRRPERFQQARLHVSGARARGAQRGELCTADCLGTTPSDESSHLVSEQSRRKELHVGRTILLDVAYVGGFMVVLTLSQC